MTKRKPTPSDMDRCIKIKDAVFEQLGAEAGPRGMSRPQLANIALSFLLEHPEIVDMLQANLIVSGAADAMDAVNMKHER
jgi:hypothetical protein